MQQVIELRYKQNMDYLQRIMDGAYSFRMISADILTKQVQKDTFDYISDFDSYPHLEKEPVNSENIYYDSNGGGRIETYVAQSYAYNNTKKDIVPATLAKRIPLLADLDMWKLQLTVSGRTDIKVGDTIIFHHANYKTRERITDTNKGYVEDPYTSGKYLVTAIQHRITQTRHRMILEVCKDSYVSPVTFGQDI